MKVYPVRIKVLSLVKRDLQRQGDRTSGEKVATAALDVVATKGNSLAALNLDSSL